MKKRAKPGGAATFLAHPRRPSRAPCQPPRSLLSPRRRSRPTSPKKPHLPPPHPRSAPPIGAGERPIRTGSSASKRTADPGPVARIPPPFCFFPLPGPLQSPRPPLTAHAPRPRFPCRILFFKPSEHLFFGARRSKPAADASSNYARGKSAGPRALSRRLEASAKKSNEERKAGRDRGRQGRGTGGGGAEREMKGKQAEKKGKNPNRLRDAKEVMFFAGSSAPKTAGLGRKIRRNKPAGSPFTVFEGGGRRGRAEASGSGKRTKKKKKRRSGAFSFCKSPQIGKPLRTYPRSAHRTAAIGSRLPPNRSNPSRSCCA